MRLNTLLIFFCLIVSSCAILKNGRIITVTLSTKEGLSSELGLTHFMTSHITPDSSAIYRAQKLRLTTYSVSIYIFNPVQFYFQQWKSGKISRDAYLSEVDRRSLDTNGIAYEPSLDANITFLLGRKSSGEFMLIADENNNNKLDDDRTLIIAEKNKDASARQIANMPKVHLSNIPIFLNGRIVQTSTTFFINTNSFYLNNNDTGLQSQAIPIELITGEYKVGRFRHKRNKYIIGVRERYPWLKGEQRNAIVKVVHNSEDSILMRKWNTRPEYKKGDIVPLKNGAVELIEINYLKSLISLKPSAQKNSNSYIVQKAEAPIQSAELTIGNKYPDFFNKADSTLSSGNLKGKVVLLNFWFAQCPPCIAEFDGLNQLYAQLKGRKDFAFISFTFENQDVVEEFKKKYNLEFPIFTISEEECTRLMESPLYPTNIVLDKKGIVKYYHVGGKTTREEASKYILTEVNSIILEEL